MNKSTVKSRINANRQRRKRLRRIKIIKTCSVMLLIAIIAVLCVIGVKGGLHISRQVKYPVEYSEYIIKYSEQNNLDPYVVISVIKQESNFVADARSPYAGGLMQLTEETASEYAAKLGLKNYNYMDPETNIMIGCFVLRTLINNYEVLDTALAAYNAGRGNVDKWLANSNYSSDGITLYYIPFEETRNYVKKIKGYIETYRENKTLE